MTTKPDPRPAGHKLRDPNVATLTLAEAAEVLGVALVTAHAAHRATGHITDGVPVLRVGRRLIVPAQPLRDRLGVIVDDGRDGWF